MKIEREMTSLTLEDMCWLMCGGPEDEDESEEDNDQQRSQENTDRSI